MKLLLIRHGLTALGEEGRYQGALDTGLSARGKAQLRTADASAGRVYVSPLLRARETAAILFPNAEQVIVPDLREMDFGRFDGRGWWEMEQDADYRAWVESGCLTRCPGGEDRAAYSKRVCAAFEGLFALHNERLIVVAHGGTQMAALSRWAEDPRDYWTWQRPCGCGWELEWDGARLQVLREVDHRI